MAGAEARAVWQRTVNRCFVQEDAKRAPKLTTSRASSTKQLEDSCSSRALLDPHNQSSCPNFIPLHRNPNFQDISPHNNNTRFWSHHPHHHIQVTKPMETEVNNGENKQVKSLNSEFIVLMETRNNYEYDESSEKKLNELSFDLSSPWNPEKAGPWWRTTDKDELASLVAQRSLDYIENCDLPTPRSFVSSQTIGPSRVKNSINESGLSKSELLEALRHSQTRAREAENMAKEAYAEKEHLVRLLFKQASELFGYKQWLQLLQLETLYLKIRNKKEETPVSIPWSKDKARRKRRSSKKAKPNFVGLALGMSLVGAGLLLGWTVGWMQMLSF